MRSIPAVLLLLVAASPLAAQAAADSADIRATALDYIDGYYTGDAVRMERALHPDLAKRIVMTDPQGHSRISFEDYALALVDEIERPKHARRRFGVAY